MTFDRLYENGPQYGKFSDAYKIIVNNYKPENEVIFGQYIRAFYLRDIQIDRLTIISMRNNKFYTLDVFVSDLSIHPPGWITWETRKSHHLNNDVKMDIQLHFNRMSEGGIDDSGIEIYHY